MQLTVFSAIQPASLQYERVMFISYLDEDMMIARDETGAPDILFRITNDTSGSRDQKKAAEEDFFSEDPIVASAETAEETVFEQAETAVNGVVGETKSPVESLQEGAENMIDGKDAAQATEDIDVNEDMGNTGKQSKNP